MKRAWHIKATFKQLTTGRDMTTYIGFPATSEESARDRAARYLDKHIGAGAWRIIAVSTEKFK